MAQQRRSGGPPQVLTTGQVARICNVAPRTVSKWFDTGELRGYRIPGSRDRRIPLDQLIRFLKAHNMPMNGLDAGPRRVLLIHPDAEVARTVRQRLEQVGYKVEVASNAFEAGLLAERFCPHAVILDVQTDQGELDSVPAAIRQEPRLADVRLLALGEEDTGQPLPRRGFDARLPASFNVVQLVDILKTLLEQDLPLAHL